MKVSTFLIAGAMIPLALGLSIDAGLLGKIIFDPNVGRWVGASLLGLAILAWYIVPILIRGTLSEPKDQVQLISEAREGSASQGFGHTALK